MACLSNLCAHATCCRCRRQLVQSERLLAEFYRVAVAVATADDAAAVSNRVEW